MSFGTSILSYFFNLIIFIQVLSSLTSSVAIKLHDYVGDKGKNISLPCNTNSTTILWLKENSQGDDMKPMLENGSLMFIDLTERDAGIYTCYITILSDNLEDSDNINNNNNSNNSNITNNNSNITNDNNNKTNNIKKDNEEENHENEQQQQQKTLVEFYKARLRIRTPPGPVASLSVRVTTIIGVLMWKFYPNQTGGYSIKCFTAEFREMVDFDEAPEPWLRLDPTHIAPSARQLEIFGLKPNATYEFRLWANNHLGAGDIMMTSGTTLPQMEEKDLIRLIMVDAKNFDTRVWIIAVAVTLITLLTLSIGTSILLCKECRETTGIEKQIV